MMMDVSRIEVSQWNLIFTLLSLDGLAPLYEEMGLHLADKQSFLALLRRLIVEARAEFGRERTPGLSFAERVMREVEELFGKRTAEFFYKWATTVFFWVHCDQPQWSAWDIILPRHPSQLPKDLPSERYEVIARFREGTSTDDVKQQVALLKSQPLTDWDAEMYSMHKFSNREDPRFEDDLVDPYSAVLSTVEMNRFQIGWQELWSHFLQDEKARLRDYGQQLLLNQEIEMSEGLMLPNDLRRQI
jgi:hypothetical protein